MDFCFLWTLGGSAIGAILAYLALKGKALADRDKAIENIRNNLERHYRCEAEFALRIQRELRAVANENEVSNRLPSGDLMPGVGPIVVDLEREDNNRWVVVGSIPYSHYRQFGSIMKRGTVVFRVWIDLRPVAPNKEFRVEQNGRITYYSKKGFNNMFDVLRKHVAEFRLRPLS